ncbi:MAG: class I SAM-dependent methyltransferase [Egibacteraceae bacterium]
MSNRYAFGDDPAAVRRLARLAELFEPTSRAFLARAVTDPPRLALDLGCGPGHTTRLLAEATGAAQTVGLDRSRAFLDRARARELGGVPRKPQGGGGMRFVEHDVTTAPFPVGPADVIFARYLLSRLADPEAVVTRWLTQLAPGGVLLLEENETITTGEPAFRDYLARAAALIREHGGELEVGARLARLAGTSEVVSFRPANADVAQLFLMNLDAQGYEGPLRTGLLPLVTQTDQRSIEWQLRQVVLTR